MIVGERVILMSRFDDYRLVTISVLVAARGRTRLAWPLGGAIAMGVGIWSRNQGQWENAVDAGGGGDFVE